MPERKLIISYCRSLNTSRLLCSLYSMCTASYNVGGVAMWHKPFSSSHRKYVIWEHFLLFDSQNIYIATYKTLITLIVCMFEAVRTNSWYGMATLIYNNLLNLILEVSRIIVPPVTQLLKSKWLNLFSRCTERKIESFWPKNLGQDIFLSVTQLFRSNFKFRQCFNFLGQDDSFFLSVHEAKKLSHFDRKIWVKF